MKTVFKILGVICIIAGLLVGHFTTIAVADYGAIALEAFGFTLLVINTLKKTEEKTWKDYVAVILFAAGGICCAIAGFTETIVSQIISTGVALITLIFGLLIIKKKNG